jgi:hypothetical protein
MDSELRQQLHHHIQRLEQYLSLVAGKEKVWFAPAAPELINQITQKYVVPQMYLEYLTGFGANRIDLETFFLFGAREMLEMQFKWNPKGMIGLLAIGENALDDPIMLLISKSNNQDAPVVSVMSDTFDFESTDDVAEESPSFLEYLELLADLCETVS